MSSRSPPLIISGIRWEFVTTLDFEWEVYTGRRPWRWSFIVYVAARMLALICIVISLVGFNVTREYGCNVSPPIVCRHVKRAHSRADCLQAWIRFVLVRPIDSVACALKLIDRSPFLVYGVVCGSFRIISPRVTRVSAFPSSPLYPV
jgi:hypothetical protein